MMNHASLRHPPQRARRTRCWPKAPRQPTRPKQGRRIDLSRWNFERAVPLPVGKFPEFVAPVFSEISLGGDTLLERSMVSWNVTQALTRNSSVTEAANPFAAFRFFEVGRCINHYVISFCYHVWQLGTCCFTAMKAVFALRFADGCFQRSSKDWW